MRHAALLLCLMAPAASAGDAAREAILPPALAWSGRSQALAVPPGDPWATPFEKSGLEATPRYDETVAFLRRLVAASPELRMTSLGKSPEGRELWMVIASREKAFTPQALRATGKPTLLAQAGIHAGEIDGKDAGLMLLRDIAARKTKAALLESANLLFVPIYNVDGHERFGARGRINQRGPEAVGWRTTARNLNLNRDYAKADAPETQAMVRALDAWDPDLYLDLHVTDGADYQYDVTYGSNGDSGLSPSIEAWLESVLLPALDRDLTAMGHVPGPLVFLVDDKDPRKGITAATSGPRFSTGYGDVRHLPALLVEDHSLKPYPQRVFGTYVLLESALRALGAGKAELRAAIAADRARRLETIPVEWNPLVAGKPGVVAPPPTTLHFKAIEWRVSESSVSGGPRVEWLGRPLSIDVPRFRVPVTASTKRPRAYWIPAAWPEVIARLALHGIRMERITQPRDVSVEMTRVRDVKLGPDAFEGHIPVAGSFVSEKRMERYPAGSVRVSTDQPLGDLAIFLLDAVSPDSFLQWGFFLEVLQSTEYVEGYVMEPMAERMLASDPGLRAEFERKLAGDPAFAKSPTERLQWFYRRTPFYDERAGLYPVGREP